MSATSSLKARAAAAIDAAAEDVVALARDIYEHPELAFEEHRAAGSVRRCCEAYRFDAAAGTAGIATALRAEHGGGALNLAFCAEYDALPGIGHSCGHNLIAGASVAAAIGLAAVADELDVTATLLGTPAEERGGGKIALLDGGGFTGVHAAFMAHPAPAPFDLAAPRTLAVAQFGVSFTGRAAHASAAPHAGVNAADAMTVAQVSLGLLRQQLSPGDQVHGVIAECGGAANIIPARSSAEYFCRAPSLESVAVLQQRVNACFEAGAVATGCTCHIEQVSKPYAELSCDAELSALFRANATTLGRHFADPDIPPLGSTDMGNVSRAIPSIHPYFGLGCLPDMPHDAGFAAHVATPAAFAMMLTISKALAATAIDAASDTQIRDRLATNRAAPAEAAADDRHLEAGS